MCPHICPKKIHILPEPPRRARADMGGSGRIWILRADVRPHMKKPWDNLFIPHMTPNYMKPHSCITWRIAQFSQYNFLLFKVSCPGKFKLRICFVSKFVAILIDICTILMNNFVPVAPMVSGEKPKEDKVM
jgi:hypothetical protein